jgi:glycosyltransferase involved in cell wall biosynthesis
MANGPHRAEIENEFPDVRLFPPAWPARWFRLQGMISALRQEIKIFDLVHIHMVWDYPVVVASAIAAASDKPFIVSTHGSFMAAWRYQSIQKKIYRAALADRILKKAASVHVLSEAERMQCIAAGIDAKFAVVPNGVDTNEFVPRFGTLNRISPKADKGTRKMLYLGRIWEEKGLEPLLVAWSAARRRRVLENWMLEIVGPDYRGYSASLRRKVEELQLADKVRIRAPVEGAEKQELLQTADAFVLPSRSEAMSMSLLEAMASGIPSLYTKGCSFPQLAENGGGIEVGNDSTALERGLIDMVSLSDDGRMKMGRAARKLAEDQFSIRSLGVQLNCMYREAVGYGR